jgi:uncharacterized protein (TIGR02452 family)
MASTISETNMSDRAGTDTDKRIRLRDIAEQTLKVIKSGSYTPPNSNAAYNLSDKIETLKAGTRYYAADSLLSTWSSSPPPYAPPTPTEISFLAISTMEGARRLHSALTLRGLKDKLGILNFASAKKPGGGFINGAQAQEESLARSSTLYPSLITSIGQQFYTLHNRDPKNGYYSHAMIYCPGVVFFRDDDGGWTEPLEADVLVSAAVNAGVVRNSLCGRIAGKSEEARIEAVMKERMARVLFLFSQKGVRNLVLGSFGTGVFQ